MELSSFQYYLLILMGLLTIIAFFVFRQFFKTRKEESSLVQFEQKGINTIESPSELYEFGSIQIKKRLYVQATETFLKAIKYAKNEPDEAKAIIENALGFSYAAQKDFGNTLLAWRSRKNQARANLVTTSTLSLTKNTRH